NYEVTFTPSRAGYSGTAVLNTTVAQLIPKYVVLSVYYAPPGAKSTTTYTDNSTQGTSTSISNTFTNSTSVSASIGLQLGIKGVISGSSTLTASQTYSQEADTSSSFAINTTNVNTVIVPGPASSSIGIDHDYDLIVVWLNPELDISINPDNTVVWHG